MRRICHYLTAKNDPLNGVGNCEFVDKDLNLYRTAVVNRYNRDCILYNNDQNGFIQFYKNLKEAIKADTLLMTGNVFSSADCKNSDNMNILSTVNSRLADVLILEFNDFLIPKLNCDNSSFRSTLLRALDSLPAEFRSVSCIAVAKSDYGLNINNIDKSDHYLFSGYIIYWLDDYVTSDLLYNYLLSLNYNSEYTYCKSLRMSDCRNEIQYCISPSTALCNFCLKLNIPQYAIPDYNPFKDCEDDRVIFIEKSQLYVAISNGINKDRSIFLDEPACLSKLNTHLTNNVQDTIPHKLNIAVVDDFSILRDRLNFLTGIFSVNADLFQSGSLLKVYRNVKGFKLRYVIDIGDFSLFAAGVSGKAKYFCYRHDPYYLIPIDSGCAFIFDEVDRESYEYHLYDRLIRDKHRTPTFLSVVSEKRNSFADSCNDALLEKITKKSAKDVFEPVSYICSTRGGIVLGLQGKKYRRFFTIERISEGKVNSVANWYRQMRRYLPKSCNHLLLRLQTVFDPSKKSGIDYERHVCNLFHPTAYMLLKYSRADKVKSGIACEKIAYNCSKIYHLIKSALGGKAESKIFISWLAKIMQEKKKTKLAWILQGIQGTGKGLLADLVLKALFGDYFIKCGVSMFDDKFDSWKDNALIIFVDEYSRHAHDKKNLSSSRIKELITEDTVSSRKMFSHYREVASFSNYIFATNVSDAMSIEASDRRFNVGTWQSVRFDEYYSVAFGKPFRYDTYVKDIEKELEEFARILNKIDYGYTLDKCLSNESKVHMSNLAETSEQTFIRLLTFGDFIGLSVIFEYSHNRTLLPAAHICYALWALCIIDLYKTGKYTKKIARTSKDIDVLTFNLPVFKTEICDLYSAFADSKCSFKKLYNFTQYMFPGSKRYTRTFCNITQRRQGYLMIFHIKIKDLYELIEDNIALKNKIDELRNTTEFA